MHARWFGEQVRDPGDGETEETNGAPGDALSEREYVVLRIWLCEDVSDPEGTGGVKVGEREGEV